MARLKASRLAGEAIAGAADGLDVCRSIRLGFHLFSQSADVNVHGSGSHCRIDAPNLIEQTLAAEHLSWM